MKQLKLEYLEVTCPTCKTEIEVKVPEGVVYQEDMVNWQYAQDRLVKCAEREGEIKRIEAIELIRAEIMLQRSRSNIFNRKKKMHNILEYVELMQKHYT